MLASPTLAASWQDAIAAVKANAAAMSEKADALGYLVHIGTVYNEYRIREHSCAILGVNARQSERHKASRI